MENVIKECQEEAGMDVALASTARPVGAVSYRTVSATGLKPDVLFVYDIQLPPSFQPVPQDGEVRATVTILIRMQWRSGDHGGDHTYYCCRCSKLFAHSGMFMAA
jgi:8-oxo-dGTP pyrophosphatase MutT (NUDIX family)